MKKNSIYFRIWGVLLVSLIIFLGIFSQNNISYSDTCEYTTKIDQCMDENTKSWGSPRSIEDFVCGFKVLGDSIFKFIYSNTMYWMVRNYAQEGEVFERHIHCYGGSNGLMAMKWVCDPLEAFRIEIFKKIIEINMRG